MYQSIPSTNTPPGDPQVFAPTFGPGTGICTIWIARGSSSLSIILITKMSVDGALRHFFSFKMICQLLQLSSEKSDLFQNWGNTLKWSSMVP